uniref:Uncharacterized protein n=1 Tax=viral metagenome TaxID=1070528 RepID=A0A6C0B2Q7_9ZZZZ
MDVFSCLFAGVLTGFFVVSIFKPPKRQIATIPTPGDSGSYTTKSGCVRIKAEPVPCSSSAVSLNVLVNDR